jgi:hypothetical protein
MVLLAWLLGSVVESGAVRATVPEVAVLLRAEVRLRVRRQVFTELDVDLLVNGNELSCHYLYGFLVRGLRIRHAPIEHGPDLVFGYFMMSNTKR